MLRSCRIAIGEAEVSVGSSIRYRNKVGVVLTLVAGRARTMPVKMTPSVTCCILGEPRDLIRWWEMVWREELMKEEGECVIRF